jgi:anti-sigma B factor antagonist
MTMDIEPLEGGATLARLEGRLDAATAPSIQVRLKGVIAEGKTRLAVDLAKVSFIDSTGLGVLVSCFKAARRAGGDLRLGAPNNQVQKLLRLTALNRVFSVSETPEMSWP